MAINFPKGGTTNGAIMNEGMQHLPCVVLLDVSSSMAGSMGELNDALAMLKENLESDIQTQSKVDICLVSFNSSAHVAAPFRSVYEFEVPELEAGGLTAMHEAVDLAISEVQVRRKQYRSRGVSSYKPFIFLMTDGMPTDKNDREHCGAFDRLMSLQCQDKWNYFPVAIGSNADREFLMRHNAAHVCLTASRDNFEGIFEFLSDSLSKVSSSKPGEAIRPDDPADYDLGLAQLTLNA